ncbi:YegS/Rv2252/BmrU family lipid kinase [Breoghania corrubedonensis]|uniref:YegS/Rv2252/BmrU family lipid kinase n=1 Tax=Breoghania corrubedonensis TaxID=665038 RepID=A0A2T5VET5_9HYPH|nr:diacylglycerol kinase family protein [Breoghania corrubedonensis]PTW62250.1 YegS/Rv2252/BmrU family lipid kinase [Breoghania corrubedonensis]
MRNGPSPVSMPTAGADRTEHRHDEEAHTAGHTLILANPTSGGFDAKALRRIAARLRDAGRTVELRLTTHAGEIGEICSDPQLAVDVLVIAGGDGSINEALTGFQSILAPPALAVVPCGTANVLAQELGLPSRPDRIADMILRRRTKNLHYGLADGRPFLLMVSAGFDALVVHTVPLTLKRRLGKLAYVITAFKQATRPRHSDLVVEADGEQITCRLAVITKAAHYGGPFVICGKANVSEPGLYLVALTNDRIPSLVRAGVALLRGRMERCRDVVIRPLTRATVTSAAPVAAQIDGDPFGITPLTIEQGPRSLTMIVP